MVTQREVELPPVQPTEVLDAQFVEGGSVGEQILAKRGRLAFHEDWDKGRHEQ